MEEKTEIEKVFIKTNRQTITSCSEKDNFNLHLPSLQQYKVPYQKHRYHQGTYGYPCYGQEQIDRFEQL